MKMVLDIFFRVNDYVAISKMNQIYTVMLYYALFLSRHVTSRQVKSRHVTSQPVTSRHVTSWNVTSQHVTECHITSHHRMSRHITSQNVTSHHGASCHVTSSHVTVVTPDQTNTCHLNKYCLYSFWCLPLIV